MPKKGKIQPSKKNNLITNYFVESDKTDIPQECIITKDSIVEFYDICLKTAESQCCENQSCKEEKSALEEQLALCKVKLEQIKRAQETAESVCEEKDGVIAALKAELVLPPTQNSHQNLTIEDTTKSLSFSTFSSVLSEEQISQIRSIGNTTTEDSTFVLHIIRSLYQDNLEKLNNISVTGRAKNAKKQPISPNKKKTVHSMFSERLDALDEAKSNLDKRKAQLNQLINRAIANIVKKNKVSGASVVFETNFEEIQNKL